MKKILALALATMLTLSLTGCGGTNNSSSGSGSGSQSSGPQDRLDKIMASGKIVFATSPDYAPYEFVDLTKIGQGQEQYVGADVELAKYIAQKLGVELVIEPMDYDAVLTAVSEKQCDMAISGIVARDDRKEKMDFSICYNPTEDNSETQTVMIRKADAEKYKTVEDLNNANVKLAVQNASLQQVMAAQQMPNATQVPIGKLSDGVMELQKGKVDALVIATTTGEGYVVSYPDLQMSGIFLQSNDDGVGVAIPKGNPALVAKIDEIVKEVVETGLYKQWEEEGKALAAAQQEETKK